MANVEDESTPDAARGSVATPDRPERVRRTDPTDKNTLKPRARLRFARQYLICLNNQNRSMNAGFGITTFDS